MEIGKVLDKTCILRRSRRKIKPPAHAGAPASRPSMTVAPGRAAV
jgi:hypothetical protein